MRLKSYLAGGALSLFVLSGTADADVLLMRDGRIIDGPKMEQKEDHVLVHFENGEVQVPDALVESVLIEGGEEYVPRTDEEKAQWEKGLVPYDGDWVKPRVREREVAKRLEETRAQIEDAIAHGEWGNRYQDETKHFRWQYTIPKHIWEGYALRADQYYEIFSKEWRVKRDKRKEKLMINFFADRKEFNRTSGAGGGALAYFMFLGDYDLCAFYDRLDGQSTEMVLYHELSHYMQKLINEDFKMPHWPGEGLSEYYGGALWDEKRKKLEVGLVQEGRLTEVRSDISVDRWLTVRDIVTKDAYTDYTWGWALVHFFMNHKSYEKGFKKFVTGLANARDVDRQVGAFNLKTVTGEEALRYLMECLKLDGEEELEEMQKEFYAYIENDLVLTSASGLEKAAIAAKNTGKPIKARRLFQEAIDAGSTSALCYHNYAQLLRGRDDTAAERYWRKATELDPVTGIYWYELGRLVERTNKEEGKRLKALGKELDPAVDYWSLDAEFTDEED